MPHTLTRTFRVGPCLAAALLLVLIAAMVLPAPADEIVGWRTDGTGRYPDATPPTQWSTDTNVLWASPLPSRSNSTLVITGNRILTCAEPTTLLCADTETGAILWQASHNYEDVAPADQLADMQKLQEECNELRRQVGEVSTELGKLRKQLQDDPENAELKNQRQQLQAKMAELNERLKPYNDTWYVLPLAQMPVNGYSSATPVTDGQHVWAVFGNGVVAAYDLEGNRLWAKPLEKPRDAYGHSASPVLAEGKLIIHIVQLTALDPMTGEIIWQRPLKKSWGTPAVTRIGDQQVIITGAGDIVKVADGTVLAQAVSKLDYASPLVQDGVVYFIEKGGKAIKLPGALDEPFTTETLWQTMPKDDRYYASPIHHEGLLYAVTQAGIFSAIDAATGEVVYEQNLALGKGTVYPSVTLAGGLLFVSSDNGNAVIIQPGREYTEIARNSLEPFRGSPVFIGDRLYMHGEANLYCIAEAGGQ